MRHEMISNTLNRLLFALLMKVMIPTPKGHRVCILSEHGICHV